MDAFLRTNEGYKRNHEKEPNIYGELSDCALMIMTALGRKHRWGIPYCDLSWGEDIGTLLDFLAMQLGTAGADYHKDLFWDISVIRAMGIIAAVPGMDMPAELRKRMMKWRNKWMPK